jgi:hypothetical protein
MSKVINNIVGGKQIETWYLTICCSHHGKGFATASLTVCETSCVGTFKCALDKGLDAFLVNLNENSALFNIYLLIICLGVKNIIESEFMALNKFCKVNFLSKTGTMVSQICWKKSDCYNGY